MAGRRATPMISSQRVGSDFRFQVSARITHNKPWLALELYCGAHKCMCQMCGLCRFINGLKAQGATVEDAKVLFYGAGSTAVGVANMTPP